MPSLLISVLVHSFYSDYIVDKIKKVGIVLEMTKINLEYNTVVVEFLLKFNSYLLIYLIFSLMFKVFEKRKK